MTRRAATVGAWVLATCFATAPASAQVDEGVRLHDDADFRGALEAFDRALEESVPGREALARLYFYRAQTHLALGDRVEMARDAARLAAVDPRRPMGRAVPPQVREAFDQAVELGAGLELEVEVQPAPGAVRLSVEVQGDPGDVVREVRLAGRAAGDPWTHGTGTSLDVPAPAATTLQYYVEVLGPGGAVVRNEGSEAEPRTRSFGVPGTGTSSALPEEDDDGGGLPLWAWVGGGALVAGLVIVLAVVLASGSGESDDTQLSPPVLGTP